MKTRYKVGALVVDSKRNRFGYVMGSEGPYVQLRPPGGGREWDADPEQVRGATDEERLVALHERVALTNRQGQKP